MPGYGLRVFVVFALCLLGGCASLAPMQSPPQLSATPGPAFIITADRYVTTAFTVWYPADWRVVSSPAFAEPHVYFISPDEQAVIALALDEDDIREALPPLTPGELRRAREIINGGDVVALMIAPEDGFDAYDAVFQRMIQSVE